MNREANNDVCVVIPVYNEASVVGDVIRTVRERYPRVVCVDDGSTDNSSAAILKAGSLLVKHPINLGQGAALQTGFEFAVSLPGIEYLVTFDADGQHDIDDVPQMIALLRAGSGRVVFGSRFLDKRTTLTPAKHALLVAAVWHARLSTGLALTDTHNGLRALDRDVAASLHLQMNGMAHASELLSVVAKKRLPYSEVPVHIRYTDYSQNKGQPMMNAINIVFDLLLR